MFTNKKFSKAGELSTYDIKSFIEQAMIVAVPYVLAHINDIEAFLTSYTGDAETVAIAMSIVAFLLRKLMKDYDVSNK